MFLHQPNVFYMPNLERSLNINSVHNQKKHIDDIIGTQEFLLQQYDLNVVWHVIEEQCSTSKTINVELKNTKYFLEKSAIDFNSSIQLTFDVITQLLEMDRIQFLPHIVKFCEICENRDHFHWIKNTMIKLQESVSMENAISHQVIYQIKCT